MVDQLSEFFRTHLYQSESIRICDANYYRHFEAICSHLTASATIKIRLLISGSQVRSTFLQNGKIRTSQPGSVSPKYGGMSQTFLNVDEHV